jgi:hypothetical protein
MSLTITLTEDEAALVQRKQKNSDELPTYYSASTQIETPISRDFEAFLILSDDQLKTSANDWIKKAADLQKVNKDRDALLALSLEQETFNAQSKMDALDQTLAGFNDFREHFQTTSDFVQIPEVQLFLFDLQRVVETLAIQRDRANFDSVMSQVVQRADDKLTVSDPEIQELQSWTAVLSAYLQG